MEMEQEVPSILPIFSCDKFLKNLQDVPGLQSYLQENLGDMHKKEVACCRLQHFMDECRLQGRWEDLWKCLRINNNARICHTYMSSNANKIWRYGIEAIEHVGDFSKKDKEIFLREIDASGSVCHEQLRTEQVMSLVQDGRFEDVLLLSQRRMKKRSLNFISPKHQDVFNLWDKKRAGLTGILGYFCWLKEDETRENDSGDETDSGNYSTTHLRDRIAEDAIVYFHHLLNEPGCNDIYLEKYVKLLESLDRNEEAEKMLRKNIAINPNNPNGRKYLYNFLKKKNTDQAQLLSVLKNIALENPSDELALEYVRLSLASSKEGNRDSECLIALFALLDYACWNEELEPWTLLCNLVKTILRRFLKEERNKLQELWDMRQETWLNFHFHKKDAVKLLKMNSKLLLRKACLGIYLMGADCPLAKKAVKLFNKKKKLKKLRKLKRAHKFYTVYNLRKKGRKVKLRGH